MDYIENINGNNYLRGLKAVKPAIKESMGDKVIGILMLFIAIVVGAMAVGNIIDGKFNFFGIIWSIMLGLFGALWLYMSKMNIRNAERFCEKLEEDINNVNLVTTRIRVMSTHVDSRFGRYDRKKRQAVNSNFSPMSLKDRNREVYYFNGIVLEVAPFEYGTELEVTYYGNTRVIHSVQIVEQ